MNAFIDNVAESFRKNWMFMIPFWIVCFIIGVIIA
jgi:Na+/glutamate symporter